jgi:hypothetical protein
VLKRAFRDYVILLYAAAAEPWSASWNDAGQMARFTNPTNGVTITSQFLQMPMDPALIQAAGDRDRFMDLALRKYCAALFGLTRDADISNQPIEIHSRTLGDHYFRYCEVWGRDREGRRRPGFFYIMLRGRAERPKFNGDSLILTIGYPELIDPKDQRAALKTFEVMLQNISFQ